MSVVVEDVNNGARLAGPEGGGLHADQVLPGIAGVKIGPGDHICALYRHRHERDDVLMPFLREFPGQSGVRPVARWCATSSRPANHTRVRPEVSTPGIRRSDS